MGRLCLGDWLDCLLGSEFNVSCVTLPPSGAQAGMMPTFGGLLQLLNMMLLAAAAMRALPLAVHPKPQTFKLYP